MYKKQHPSIENTGIRTWTESGVGHSVIVKRYFSELNYLRTTMKSLILAQDER